MGRLCQENMAHPLGEHWRRYYAIIANVKGIKDKLLNIVLTSAKQKHIIIL
jgi:hypothetical protein